MKRLVVLVIAALAAVLLVAAPASSTGPALSSGCAQLHALEPNGTLGSSGTISVGPFAFAAGEELRVESVSDSSGTGPFVTISRAGSPDAHLSFNVGETEVYAFPASDTYAISIVSRSGPSSFAVKLGCGLPPVPTATFAAQDPIAGQPENATIACTPQTNPLASCAVTMDSNPQGTLDPACAATGCTFALNTASPGSHLVTVTGTDTRGLVRSDDFWYSVTPKQTQTITFTSTPPPNPVWNQTSDLGDYVPTATATSGLPVRFSVDPNSTGCRSVPGVIGDPGSVSEGRITVYWNGPGPCTIIANQDGDATYQAAPPVVQSFVIGRETVDLSASLVGKGILGLSPTTFRAELKHSVRFGPGQILEGYPGQVLTFSINGQVLCSGTTVFQASGFSTTAVATCKAPIGLVNALTAKSYTVSYAGNADSLPATATGVLWPPI